MILILLCDGFEEIEALMPYDILDRAAFNVKTVGLDSKEVTGTHGIKVIADLSPSEVDLSDVELVIFPGGLPGAVNLKHHDFTDKIIKAVRKNGGRLDGSNKKRGRGDNARNRQIFEKISTIL